MVPAIKSIFLALVFGVTLVGSLSVYGQETTDMINDQIRNTAEQIKNMADEVANNSSDTINQTEAKQILMQLGEAARKTALGGADVLSNISGEIREGLQ